MNENILTKVPNIIRLVCFSLLTWLSITNNVIAQNSTLEFWPETDIWYRFDPSWRLSAFIPITKYHESQERDMNVYVQADYSWGLTKRLFFIKMVDQNRMQILKTWMVRSGYMKGWSLDDPENGYSEDMIYGEIHRRIPIKGDIVLSHRLRTDLRWVGQDPEFSYRLRYRFMIEKEIPVGYTSFNPYFNAEPFYDSRYEYFNRLRLVVGSTFTWKSWFALEGNLTYQYDEKYNANNLYALNIIFHLFFENESPPPKN